MEEDIEFKNLNEIIELCVKELYTGDRNIHATLGFEELKELQSLLNKRRVLERHAVMLINKNKEQEKMIELMVEYIAEDDCELMISVENYFRKKAKGE